VSRDDSCIQTIIDAYGGKKSRDDADDMLTSIQGAADKLLKSNPALDQDSAFQQAVKNQVTRDSLVEAQARREKLLNLQKNVEARNTVIGTADKLAARKDHTTAKDMYKGVLSVYNGIQDTVEGGRAGIQQDAQAYESKLTGAFLRELTEHGVWKDAKAPKNQLPIMQELWELSQGEKGKPGSSGNDEAQIIAKIMNKYLKSGVKAQNDQGAWIKNLSDFIIQNEHDWYSISHVGQTPEESRKIWKDDLMNKGWLDKDKTLEGKGDGPNSVEADKFLDNVHRSLVSGEHFAGGRLGFNPKFEPGANRGKSVSQERILHFDGPEATYQYWSKYGKSDNMIDAVRTTLERSAKNAALMRQAGTTWPDFHDRLVTRVMQHYTDTSDATALEARNFNDKYVPKLQKRWNELTGENDRPANQIAANLGSALRTWENITSLGRLPFAHVSLIATRAFAAKMWGRSALHEIADSITNLMPGSHFGGLHGEDSQLLMDMIGGHNNAYIGAMTKDWHGSVNGAAAKVNNIAMRLNGIPWLLDKQQAGAMGASARWGGRMLEKSFDDLPEGTGANLQSYNISKEDWQLLRNATDPVILGERNDKYLTPDLAMRTEPSEVEDIIRSQNKIGGLSPKATPTVVAAAVKRYQEDLSFRLTSMFEEESRRALARPGSDIRAILHIAPKGSLAGELTQMFLQFKQWPINLTKEVLGRGLYGSQSTGQTVAALQVAAAGLLVAGYLRDTLNAAVSGTPLPDPTDPKTIAHAALSGGLGTVYGETLHSMAYSQDWVRSMESALGPGATSAMETYKNAHDLYESKPVRLKNKQLDSMVPEQNLWWLNLVNDRIMGHAFQKMIHPDWNDQNSGGSGTRPILSPR